MKKKTQPLTKTSPPVEDTEKQYPTRNEYIDTFIELIGDEYSMKGSVFLQFVEDYLCETLPDQFRKEEDE
jgi:hypothetical protein